jgi:thioredoxin reductase (NADPH)
VEERDVVIVGAGPAGLSAAIFTQLDGWSTLVLEESWVGGQGAVSYTLSNYPGFPADDGALLMQNMEKQATLPPPAGVGAQLRRERVISLNAKDKIVTTEVNQYRAQTIIIATGSTMIRLGIPGEDIFTGKGVSYYAKRDHKEFTGKKVLVVGAGNSGAKSALLARTETADVTVIEFLPWPKAYPVMVKTLEEQGIKIWCNTGVKEIRGDGKVKSVVLVNSKTAEQREVATDWLIICVGTEPNTELARQAGIEMAGRFIKVNDKMMTDRPGIFACSEITGSHRHLITSAAQGASAGMAASEHLALEKVKRGEMFGGAINGKLAKDYIAMLS